MRLADKSEEDHLRWVYDGEMRPWSVIVHGILLSAYKGVQWCGGCCRRKVVLP